MQSDTLDESGRCLFCEARGGCPAEIGIQNVRCDQPHMADFLAFGSPASGDGNGARLLGLAELLQEGIGIHDRGKSRMVRMRDWTRRAALVAIQEIVQELTRVDKPASHTAIPR